MVTSRAVSAGASGAGSSGPGAVGGRAISPRRAAAAWERAYWEAAAGSAVAASKEDSGSSSRTPTWPAEAPLSSQARSEEHTSELQSRGHLVCRLLLE